jgi:hypothetical protein
MTTKEYTKKLRELGASMLSGVVIPTHQMINHGYHIQVITVAEHWNKREFDVIYRKMDYSVYTMKLDKFKSLFIRLEEKEADAA